MQNNDVVGTNHPAGVVHVFKWLLFALELFLLWVLCNTLFLVPGPYRGGRGIIIVSSAVLASLVSWGSGRLFQRASAEVASVGKTFSSPPVVICIFVLVVATVVMTVAILATR